MQTGNNKPAEKRADMNRMIFLLFPVLSFAGNITDTTIDLFASDMTERHRSLKSVVSINTYSQLYLHQSGIGSGYVGAIHDFTKKICWGLGLRPEYNLNSHLFSVHFEYSNKHLHYYCTPVVAPPHDSLDPPYPSKLFLKNRYHYFCCGLGYGYQIKVNDLIKINVEVHLSDRMLLEEKQPNEFYLAPYLSLNFKCFGIFFKENIQLSRERWESETMSSVLGVNWKIRLFEK